MTNTEWRGAATTTGWRELRSKVDAFDRAMHPPDLHDDDIEVGTRAELRIAPAVDEEGGPKVRAATVVAVRRGPASKLVVGLDVRDERTGEFLTFRSVPQKRGPARWSCATRCAWLRLGAWPEATP